MNEAELLESLNLTIGNLLSAYAVFLTLATSYVVVAQLAGKTLSTPQTTLLTILYSVAMAIMISVLHGQNLLSDSLRIEQLERFPRGGELDVPFAPITLVSNLLIYLGTLKYMWDIRKSIDGDA